MSNHTVQTYPLPHSGLVIAESHTLTAEGLRVLAAGEAERTREGVWTWSTATEGDRTPGG